MKNKQKTYRKNNGKYFLLVFILLLVASFLVIYNKGVNSSPEIAYLVPELQNQINDVEQIVIRKNEQIISLSKQSGVWRVAEANNYLADANMIASLLLDLRQLKLKEKKTAMAENFSILQLDSQGEFAATQIQLRNAQQQFADVLVGKNAQNTQAMYVRKNAENQAWLAEGKLSVKLKADEWIVTNILDIAANQIQSVTFQSENQQFGIDKLTPSDETFALQGVPENLQVKADANLEDLAIGLQKFSIISAKARDNQLPEPILTVTYQLFSGMRYHLSISQIEQQYYLNIDLENADAANDIEKQLENWTYLIAQYKFDGLNKKLEDLLQEKVTETVDVSLQKNG